MTGTPIVATPGYGSPSGTAGVVARAAASGGRKKTWLELQHPEYRQWSAKWTFATEHYTGAVIDPNRVTDYLPRKALAETLEAYRERTALADYTPHFSQVVDSLAGMLFGVEGDANREWAPKDAPDSGLGDPTNPDTPAGRLVDDADGRGSSWLTMWKRLGIQLLVNHRSWVLVDSVDEASEVHIVPVLAVTNWRAEKGRLAEVLVCEQADVRTNLADESELVEHYIHYRLDGWTRYQLNKNSGVITTISEGAYHYTDRRKKPALPIYMVELPLARPVGWMLARKANAIFNKESERDHLLRAAQLAIKFIIFGGKEYVEEIRAAMAEGNAALPAPPGGPAHAFIAPSGEPATVANAVLAKKVEEFYIVAFREYGNAARGGQRTATEVRQDLASGAGALLQLLKGAVDEAENEAFWRVEQTEFPNDTSVWFRAHVERSDEFAVEDANTVIDRLQKRYFVERIPVGREAMMDAARKAAEWDGLPVDEDEIASAVDLHTIEQTLQTASQLPLGATARKKLAIQFCEALGLFGDDEDPATGGNEDRAVIEAEIEAVAQAEQKATVQASSFAFPRSPLPGDAGGGGAGNGGTDGGKQPPTPTPKAAPRRFQLTKPDGTPVATLAEG